MKQYSFILRAVHIVFSILICFTFLKVLIRNQLSDFTNQVDVAVWKNTTPGQCYRLMIGICHVGITREAKWTSPPSVV